MSALLAIRGLGVRYPGTERWVLDAAGLDQYAGRVTAVIGPSGCGKSSLVRTACGLVPHCIPADYRGSVVLDGTEMADAEVVQIATRIGFVGQNPDAAVVARSLHDEVCFPLQNLCLPPDEIEARATEALGLVGLGDRPWDDPWVLSGGQRQRLALAVALAMKPDLLVLDEPTSTIDPEGREDFYRLLPPLIEQGMGVLVIDHDLDLILPMVDQIIALDGAGRTIAAGSPDEVYRAHRAELDAAGIWLPRALRPVPAAAPPGLGELCRHDVVRYLARADGRWQEIDRLDTASPEHPAGCELTGFGVPGRSPAVSARLGGGELVALIGENGAGKTSLLGALAGVVRASGGTATIDGTPVKAGDPRVGYVFQNPEHQFVTSSVGAELAFDGLGAAQVDRLLDQFHLTECKDQHPLTLSGGQSRRLSVATMVSAGKRLIALDEPTYGQDWANTCELMDFIHALRADGASVLMATHDLELAVEHATHIIALPLGVERDRPPAPPPQPNASLLGSLNPFAMVAAILLPAIFVVAHRDVTANLVIMILASLVMAASRTRWRRIVGSIAAVWLVAAAMTWAVSTAINPDLFTGIRSIGGPGQAGTTIGALLALVLVSGIATDPEAILRAATTRLHLPYRLASAGTAALAFLARFRIDFRLLRTARALRGVGRRWGPLGPVVRWASSIVPLLIIAVQHGERVALSMDSRAFGAFDHRTELITDPWRGRDTAIILLIWAATIAVWILL
ncbi:ATP-binding cassette domain-containing protein [Propionibacterium australiense]|uniref:ABC transporter n=1 Tax=Propionibacterium australiense TaxID=119981 RepID=A0A383S556_9ACTN|nr:ATP-binding cassette domain-containing protein [Propionibacterium australiense]RLP12634.1 ATP-binding cassette domain-containing protein [Propionibacterium australiense]SYZ32534.1 ABC transporter [Propionibacterium australiense]VEH91715.1 Putative HMP/thiamine import ATP-binding protein YkoD [Propionibacterium australiense]